MDPRFGLDVGIDRDQVVLTLQLQAVPGKIEQRRVAVADLAAEFGDRTVHAFEALVFPLDDFKTKSAQSLGDVFGIMGRVAEFRQDVRTLITAIADHQGDALGSGRRQGTEIAVVGGVGQTARTGCEDQKQPQGESHRCSSSRRRVKVIVQFISTTGRYWPNLSRPTLARWHGLNDCNVVEADLETSFPRHRPRLQPLHCGQSCIQRGIN